jgi:predicted ribosomally synthesized peptide with nif11-like leader
MNTSKADFERLMEDLRKSPALREDLKRRVHDLELALEWAREKGYFLSREDLTPLTNSNRELTDDELEDAAGGDDAWGSTPPPQP